MDAFSLLLSFCDVSTIALCLVLKIPQMANIVASKSVQGLSLTGLLLELTSYSISMVYNIDNGLPLEAYLEYPFLVLQDVVLLLLVLRFSARLSPTSAAGVAAYLAVLYASCHGAVPSPILVALMSLCTPIGAMSKVAQLRAMHSSQNSASVSVFSYSMSAYTCLTRIVTTMARSSDLVVLANFSVSMALNMAIIWLALVLRRPSKSAAKKTQ